MSAARYCKKFQDFDTNRLLTLLGHHVCFQKKQKKKKVKNKSNKKIKK